MNKPLSEIGQSLTRSSGILELMDDLGQAMSRPGRQLMLGGGNPALVPGLRDAWRARMAALLADGDAFDQMLLNYDTPKGRPAFMDALAGYLQRRYGWPVTAANIAVTNGTQNAFFHLFNLLAEPDRPVQLALSPEYIGYADQGMRGQIFRAARPRIELIGEHHFKYRIDFDQLGSLAQRSAIAFSRPTNPSGNVLTDEEVATLSQMARAAGIPLVVDNAYGAPFPGILFEDTTPLWEPHVVYSLSLSKFGLPGTRTGMIVADESIIKSLTAVNAIANLASGNIGQELVTPLLLDDSIDQLCEEEVRPFYQARAKAAEACLHSVMPEGIPWRMHVCQGSMFLWLWCEGLPIPASVLYERLKQREVIIVPGHYFFFGLDEAWAHQHECLRINYAMAPDIVAEGLEIIAEEIGRAYAEKATATSP